MVLGIAMTVKIAIYPQVLPFIVKDEMRIESAIAYNQSMDHLLTSLSLLSVGLFS
jgi:cytochrome bd-type quinol oxidase subunit 2